MGTIYIPSGNSNYVTQDQLLSYATVNSLNAGLSGKLSSTNNPFLSAGTGVFGNIIDTSITSGTGAFIKLTSGTGTFTNVLVNGTITQNNNNNIVLSTISPSGPQGGGVMIGPLAGYLQMGTNAIGIGTSACYQSSTGTNLGFSTIGIGTNSMETRYGFKSVGLGFYTGNLNCGNECVLIGSRAGQINCPSNTIVMDCTNSTLCPTTPGVYIGGIQSRAAGKGVDVLCYDNTTKEIYRSST